MEFASVIFLKVILASAIWTLFWLMRFTVNNAEPNGRRLAIVFAPWIVMFLYVFLFWWG